MPPKLDLPHLRRVHELRGEQQAVSRPRPRQQSISELVEIEISKQARIVPGASPYPSHGSSTRPPQQQQQPNLAQVPVPFCDDCIEKRHLHCTHWQFSPRPQHPRANFAQSARQLSSREQAATPSSRPISHNSNEAGFPTLQAMESSGAGAHVARALAPPVPMPHHHSSLEPYHAASPAMTVNLYDARNFGQRSEDDVDGLADIMAYSASLPLKPDTHYSPGPVASNERASAIRNTDTGNATQATATADLPTANHGQTVIETIAPAGEWTDPAAPHTLFSAGDMGSLSEAVENDPDLFLPEQVQAENWDFTAEAINPSVSEPEQPNPADMADMTDMGDMTDMTGYAQIIFPDGEYILSSTSVSLGRDPQVFKSYRQQMQRAANAESGRERAAQRNAEEALSEYRKEPSQPSQHDGDPSSNSSHSLEGRPAPGLPSNYSEQGGIISMGDKPRKKKKNKKFKFLSGQSSSTNSIAPANLHTFTYNETDDSAHIGADGQATPFVPVHPTVASDITRISREHLLIYFNPDNRQWQLEVMGNAAYVHNEHCYESLDEDAGWEESPAKHLLKGAVVRLTHNSEIIVSSLAMKFRLPQGKAKSTFDSDSESDSEVDDDPLLVTDSARRLSNAMGDGGSDDEDLSSEEEVALASLVKGGKKKKEKKPRRESKAKPALKLKLKARKSSDAGPAPATSPDASKKPDKGKKPKKSLPPPEQPEPARPEEPVAAVAEMSGALPPPQQALETAAPAEKSPQVPLTFEPGSLLGDVPPDQLPEKRKGPGRPPKNGLVSKRDMGLVKRRQKEYEKMGQQPPTFDDILKIVRAENKIREAAQKAAQRGEAPAATPSGTQVMQSIEMTDAQMAAALINANNAASSSRTTPTKQLTGDAGMPASADAADAEAKAEKNRNRTLKSPSPMKSKAECTEAELTKPNQTYYHTLDEILSEAPPQGLELQQIYDKVCKKYPYFKYGVEGHGWQSSVRHNLKQHPRFTQVEKQGKGWLWAIDHAVPLDKEKKRKPTPPPQAPRPQMQYGPQNGQMQQQQYGAQQYAYGNTFGQSGNGQQPYQQQPQQGSQPGAPGDQYASPYGQAGQNQPYGAQGGQQGYMANANQPSFPYQPQPNLQQGNGQQQAYQANGMANQQPYPPQGDQRLTSNTPQPDTADEIAPLVHEIMAWRQNYFNQWVVNTPEYLEHEALFTKCVNWISEVQLNNTPTLDYANDEEKMVYGNLKRIMDSWERRKAAQDARNDAAAAAQSQTAAAQGQAPSAAANATAGASVPPAGSVPPPAAQMAQPQQMQAQARNDVVSGAFNPVQAPVAQRVQQPVHPQNTPSRPTSTHSVHSYPPHPASSASQPNGNYATAPAQQQGYMSQMYAPQPSQFQQLPQGHGVNGLSPQMSRSNSATQQPSYPPAGSLTYSPAPSLPYDAPRSLFLQPPVTATAGGPNSYGSAGSSGSTAPGNNTNVVPDPADMNFDFNTLATTTKPPPSAAPPANSAPPSAASPLPTAAAPASQTWSASIAVGQEPSAVAQTAAAPVNEEEEDLYSATPPPPDRARLPAKRSAPDDEESGDAKRLKTQDGEA